MAKEKIKLPSFKKAAKKIRQEGQAIEIAHNMLEEQGVDVHSLARTMIQGLPKASHKQSIQSVIRAIEIQNDPTIPENVKKATAIAATKIVSNSNSMDLADMMDNQIGVRARQLLEEIQQ